MGGSNSNGSPVFDEFVVIKQLDGATTGLLNAARDGTLLASATIDICMAGQCPLRFELTNVTVTAVSPGITETVTLNYDEITQTFNPTSGPPSVTSGPLDVGTLGGVVLGNAFTAGSGNVDGLFVRFDEIKGSSTDESHSEWSDALVLSGGHLSAAPAVELAEFVVLKPVDTATPLLLQALAQNDALKTLEVELCNSGPPTNCFMTYEFSDARLTRISSAGENEEVTFSFDMLTQTFHGPTGDQTFVFNQSP
jgi:type VI secretion system secreted protein Hcp